VNLERIVIMSSGRLVSLFGVYHSEKDEVLVSLCVLSITLREVRSWIDYFKEMENNGSVYKFLFTPEFTNIAINPPGDMSIENLLLKTEQLSNLRYYTTPSGQTFDQVIKSKTPFSILYNNNSTEEPRICVWVKDRFVHFCFEYIIGEASEIYPEEVLI